MQIATNEGEIKHIEGELRALKEADTHPHFRKGRLGVGGMVIPLSMRKMSPAERDLECRRMELKGDNFGLHLKVSTELTRDVPTIAATADKLEDPDAGTRVAAIQMLGMLLRPHPFDDVLRRHGPIGYFSDSSDEEPEEPPSLADDPVAIAAITAIGARLQDADPSVHEAALATLSGLSRSLLERQKVSMAEALRPYAAAITETEEMHLCLLLDRLSPAHVIRPAATVCSGHRVESALCTTHSHTHRHDCAHTLPTLPTYFLRRTPRSFAPQESKCFILALDSLGWDAAASMEFVERYLLAFLNRTRPAGDRLMELSAHVAKVTVAVPNQENGFDCGLHACEYAGKIAQRLAADRAGIMQRLHAGCDTFEEIFGVPGNTVAEITQKRQEYEEWLRRKHTMPSDAWESFGEKVPTPAQLKRELKRKSETPGDICECPAPPALNRIMLTEKELAILHEHANNDKANYLNDELMNVILRRMATPSSKGGLERIGESAHVFSTHFLTKFEEKGIGAVKRWTKAVEDLLGKDVLFVPYNVNKNHWRLLAVVNPAALRGLMGGEESEEEKDTEVGDRPLMDLASEDEEEGEEEGGVAATSLPEATDAIDPNSQVSAFERT
jgi:hypothetical protein